MNPSVQYDKSLEIQWPDPSIRVILDSSDAAYNFVQFWDGRAKDLADQAGGPPLNPIEMDSNWEQITGKLTANTELMALHAEVYGSASCSDKTIMDAIAEFEKTLITPGSRLDMFLMGDDKALTPDAAAGYDLFIRHSCATCHAGKSMGGQSFEKPIDPAAFYGELGREPVKDDYGRFNETQDEADRYKMKVPNLRNLAITFPYLHDGSTSDLRDVVRLMANHFVPELNRRRLTDEDVEKIVAMLNQNTGTLHGKSLVP